MGEEIKMNEQSVQQTADGFRQAGNKLADMALKFQDLIEDLQGWKGQAGDAARRSCESSLEYSSSTSEQYMKHAGQVKQASAQMQESDMNNARQF